jgi:ATP-binding protein involved in chromosome partitioning
VTKRTVPGVRRIVAVASGKGGVGKTTVTVNLALALVSLGHRVGVFDADLYGPNVPLMLGVTRQRAASSTLVPVARADPQPYIQPLERFGLRVMSFALLVGESDTVLPEPRFAGMLVERTLRDVVWSAPGAPPLDVLLIDLPPGSGEPQQSLVQSLPIDAVVAVTTPQDMSLMDTGRSLGLYRKAAIPVLGVVENMSYLMCPHCDERVDLFQSTDRAWEVRTVPTLARLPLDPALSRPVSPENVTEPFRDLAAAVVTRL